MPVNPLPILIPLFLIWAAIAILLLRSEPKAGFSFLGLTAVAALILYTFTRVKKRIDEPMTAQIDDIWHIVTLTRSDGEKFTDDSPELYAHLKGHSNSTVHVIMWGTYDFCKMRGYFIRSVDGFDPFPEANHSEQ